MWEDFNISKSNTVFNSLNYPLFMPLTRDDKNCLATNKPLGNEGFSK